MDIGDYAAHIAPLEKQIKEQGERIERMDMELDRLEELGERIEELESTCGKRYNERIENLTHYQNIYGYRLDELEKQNNDLRERFNLVTENSVELDKLIVHVQEQDERLEKLERKNETMGLRLLELEKQSTWHRHLVGEDVVTNFPIPSDMPSTEPDPTPERPHTAFTCTRCKATRWVDTGNDVHKCPRCGGMMIEEQEQEQDRPEPRFKAGDWVISPRSGPWQIGLVDGDQCSKDDCDGWFPMEALEPADPPECVCDVRKREEEAGWLIWRENVGFCSRERRYMEDTITPYTHCIHCHGEIKRSLIGGDE